MIDIHCHILPDVDDGAVDMTESVEMLRIAAILQKLGLIIMEI